jgi:hypothetical protein
MTETRASTWDDVRRIADELKLQMHLAGMDVRDRWDELQPRLAGLEQTIAREGERAGKVVAAQIAAMGTALRELRDELKDELKAKLDAKRTGE